LHVNTLKKREEVMGRIKCRRIRHHLPVVVWVLPKLYWNRQWLGQEKFRNKCSSNNHCVKIINAVRLGCKFPPIYTLSLSWLPECKMVCGLDGKC
jgi:hypothetical protein